MDDETFCREAAAHIDVPSLMRYTLLVQGMALCDNIFNNMYVWAHETAAGVVYRFIPWDMDLSCSCRAWRTRWRGNERKNPNEKQKKRVK